MSKVMKKAVLVGLMVGMMLGVVKGEVWGYPHGTPADKIDHNPDVGETGYRYDGEDKYGGDTIAGYYQGNDGLYYPVGDAGEENFGWGAETGCTDSSWDECSIDYGDCSQASNCGRVRDCNTHAYPRQRPKG